ncbi:hypothetical protein ACOMHN_016560 [Nucella lapillus]
MFVLFRFAYNIISVHNVQTFFFDCTRFTSTSTLLERGKNAALAFVPIERLDEAWLEIQAGVEDETLTTAFSDYFVTTWLDDVDSRFPRSVWNHNDNMSTGNMRTNNSLESWHRNLKRLVGSAHPNIFKIVRNLKKEQPRVDTSLRALRLGQQVAMSPRKAIRRKKPKT